MKSMFDCPNFIYWWKVALDKSPFQFRFFLCPWCTVWHRQSVSSKDSIDIFSGSEKKKTNAQFEAFPGIEEVF